jgi:hypothetical protein
MRTADGVILAEEDMSNAAGAPEDELAFSP